MAEREFKRKRKPSKAQAGPPALKLITSRSNDITPVYQPTCDMGLPYSAGPLYGLAATAEARAFDKAAEDQYCSDRPANENTEFEDQQVAGILHSPLRGKPMDPALRNKMERRFGRSFKHVELHTGPIAQQVTRSLNAKAFTHRQHIWLGSQTNANDSKVIAHELTHVVQQGHAQPLRYRSPIALAPTRPVPVTRPRSPTPSTATAAAPATVQRLDLWGSVSRVGGAAVSGVRGLARGAAGVVHNGLELGRDALLAVARRVAPDFVRLFERDGIRGFLREMLARGLRMLFGGPLGALRRMFNIGGLRERFSRVANWFVTIAGQLARNDCSGITRAAQRFGDFMSRTFEPVVERVRGISRSISEFFSGIWDAVGAPVMGLLRRIGGTVWESIRGFIRDVGSVIRRVREALGPAWTRVKEWVGIVAEEGAEEGGRLWNWIREKASQVWESIRGPLQPIMGPLRTVGTVLVLISPAGPVIAAIAAWPYLRQAFQWVRDRWRDLNLVVRAREFMTNTVLPAVREAAQRVGDALVRAADWLLEKLGAVAAGVQSITGRLTGGILAPLGRVISFLSGQFRRLVEWARGGLRYVATNARSLFRRLIEFIQPIMTVLRQLMLAVVNPGAIPGILLGTLWRVVPTCLKGPIINFILDLLLRFLRIIPPLPQLGILWPFIRAAMLGFLERVRSFATERKVNVSNKIARIISGESFGFIIGYLRGLVLGLWDGIVGPFLAIRDLFQLPEMVRNFLRSLGVRLCDFLSAIRCFMSTLSAGAIGAFDSLMEAAGDMLDNPGRIIDLIRCAIQGVLSAVEGIGTAIANRMMALFEGPEDRIGESLGRLVGSALLDVVLAYFTAGSSTALTVIRRIAGLLRTVGRNLMRVVRMVRSLIPRFLGFIRRLGGMFRRAGSRAGGLLSRIGQFFRRIANWFGRLLRRVGRRFRRAGERGRRRGPSRAERERRKRLVKHILRGRLTRGIGRIRLRLLMTGLKLLYRIRTLRLRRLGRRRYQVVIRNSPAETIAVHEVFIDDTPGGGRRAILEPRGARGLGARPHAVIRHSASSIETPTEALTRAGYRVDREPFSSVGLGFMERPRQVSARFLRWFPRGIARTSATRRSTVKKARFGRAEELLRRGTSRGRWDGGHLIGNQFGGPGTQWNLTPMTPGLNQRAYLSAETWLRSEWNHLRRPGGGAGTTNTRASASVSVSVRGYRSNYVVSKQHITDRLDIPERSPGSGADSVSVKGFVPRGVRMRVRFRGQGVRTREFTRTRRRSGTGYFSRYFNRPEDALREIAINREDDVIMRIGEPVTRPSSRSQLPPEETTPREQRRILRNNSTVFNFRQWRP